VLQEWYLVVYVLLLEGGVCLSVARFLGAVVALQRFHSNVLPRL
jgi:hypothetical protein